MVKYYRKQPVEAIQWSGDNQKEVSEFIHKVSKNYATRDEGYGNLNVCYMDSKKLKHQTVIPKFGWVIIDGKALQFYKDETFKKTFKAAEEDEDEDPKDDDKSEPSILDLARQTDRGSYKRLMEIIDKDFEDKAHSKWLVDYFGAPVIHVRRDFEDTINKEARAANIRNRAQSLADLLLRGCISRAEAEKYLLGGVTFGSVLDEMELITSTPTEEEIAAWKKQITISRKEAEKYLLGGVAFDSVLDEMKELHAKKNADYGDAFHKSFVEFGPTAGIVRLNDKMERVKSLVRNDKAEVKDESLLDTLKDMSCYAAMLYVELKNKENETDKD